MRFINKYKEIKRIESLSEDTKVDNWNQRISNLRDNISRLNRQKKDASPLDKKRIAERIAKLKVRIARLQDTKKTYIYSQAKGE